MSDADRSLHDKLDQLQAAIEGTKRRPWADYLCAVLLSLASVGSAWCAYQSSRWSGVQTFRLAASNTACRKAVAHEATAKIWQTVDVQMVSNLVEAKFRGDDKYAEFILKRIRPDARAAVDAWLKMNPLSDPNAPKHPFLLKEYRQPDLETADELNAEAARLHDLAYEANGLSDRYTLLTVLFATVMFFAGVSGTMQSRFLRRCMMILATVILVRIIIALIDLPICND